MAAQNPKPGLLVRSVGTDGPWQSPEMSSYTNEDHLQGIIAADPQQIPGVPEGAWTVREFPTGAGPADVCIVAPDGSATVVECKLASNSERRRMVLGQVLDYASAICEAGSQAFHEQWIRQGGVDLASVLGGTAFDQLGRNIDEGRIHLCLAVDQIDADLRRLVEYLNRITRDDIGVTALQLTYARHGDVEILSPSTYGGEIVDTKTRSSTKPAAWTKDTFLDALVSDDDRDRVTRLFTLLDALGVRYGTHDDLWFGNRQGGGIFFHPYGLTYAPFQLRINKSGQLMVYGTWNQYDAVRHHPGFADLATLTGQDHRSTAKAFPITDLDMDQFWQVVLDCARRINEIDDQPE